MAMVVTTCDCSFQKHLSRVRALVKKKKKKKKEVQQNDQELNNMEKVRNKYRNNYYEVVSYIDISG